MEKGTGQKVVSLLWRETGIALPTTLVIMAALLGLGSAGLIFSRSDLMVSKNVVDGTKALWAAGAGTEVGKNWLETNLSSGPFPTTLDPTTLADGTYTVTIDRYTTGVSDGKFRITSTGTGPNNARKVVEEVVRVPGLNPLAAINIDGDGTHPDFDDGGGGTGRRIPDFSIDGRDHDQNGNIPGVCGNNIPAIAGTQGNIQTDVSGAVDDLKCNIVKRANSNSVCGGCPTSPGSNCDFGLCWVRSLGYTDNQNCNPSDPNCCKNLDLSDSRLRATSDPPASNTPASPNNRGPFMFDTPADITDPPLVQILDASGIAQLRQAINDILDLSLAAPASKKLCVTGDITTSGTYGTWAAPKIVIIPKPNSQNSRLAALSNAPPCNGQQGNDLDIKSGAVVNGTGILIVPKKLRVKDATLNWQGIVVVLEDGDFRVEDEDACGAILGAVILQDDQGNDPKVDLDKVEASDHRNLPIPPPAPCPNGFSINYSCEAINNAFSKLLMQTASWTEQFGA